MRQKRDCGVLNPSLATKDLCPSLTKHTMALGTMFLSIGRLRRAHLNPFTLAADDPVSCAIYAKENNLLEQEGWKHFKRLAWRQKKLIRLLN